MPKGTLRIWLRREGRHDKTSACDDLENWLAQRTLSVPLWLLHVKYMHTHNTEYFHIFCDLHISFHNQFCATVLFFFLLSKTVGNKVRKNHSATKPPALHCCTQQALRSPPELWACLSKGAVPAEMICMLEEAFCARFCASICVRTLSVKIHFFGINKDIRNYFKGSRMFPL